MKKINWSLEKLLEWETIAFIVGIVLIPKFPFIQTTSSVPIRYDDFFIVPPLITSGLIVIKNGEIKRLLSSRLSRIILLWLAVILLATLIGIYQRSIDNPTVALLFWLRYVQYFSVFFVAITVLRNSKDLPKYFLTLVGLIIPIGIYAVAQRLSLVGGFGGAFYNYQWLTGVDRSFATFAGPYELAAFMVLTTPILAALVFHMEIIWYKILWLFTYILAILALSFTAARTPLVAVFVGVNTLSFFLPNWKKKILILGLSVILLVVPFMISDTLVTRSREFLQTFQSFGRSVVYKNPQPQISSVDDKRPLAPPPAGQSGGPGTPYLSWDEYNARTGKLATSSDQSNASVVTTKASPTNSSPTTMISKQPKSLVPDLFAGILDKEGNNISASALPQTSSGITIEPSLKWRIDNLWPQAWRRFQGDPITGGGLYSAGISVDSTYLTLLGESGLLGIGIFFLLLWEIARIIVKNIRVSVGLNKLLFMGLLGGMIALLINAVFIDVFRASKIAYLFWFLVGISVKYYEMHRRVYE